MLIIHFGPQKIEVLKVILQTQKTGIVQNKTQ